MPGFRRIIHKKRPRPFCRENAAAFFPFLTRSGLAAGFKLVYAFFYHVEFGFQGLCLLL